MREIARLVMPRRSVSSKLQQHTDKYCEGGNFSELIGKFIFTSLIVFGLIFNSTLSADLAFADKPDKEAAKEAREAAKETAKEAREAAKEAKQNIQEFGDAVVISSSSSSSTDKVTICHIPPGNPGNAHTITVGAPAVRAHLGHGDYVEGSCDSANLDSDSNNDEKELRFSESSEKESRAMERAEQLIAKLEQQIANLEIRLQNLLEKYESGEYYGNISNPDSVTNSYVISFEGVASSIYDDSVTTEMSGELFMENQVTTKDISKFKILSGEIFVGDAIYDVAFGKARLSSSGSSEEDNSLVVVLQAIDSEENENTIKITLGFDSSIEVGFDASEEFEILDNSRISGQWNLDGNGELVPET